MASASESSVQRRLRRLGAPGVRRGLTGVNETAALAAVGLHPVCEVIGAVANAANTGGFYASAPSRSYTSAGDDRYFTYSGPPGARYLSTPTFTSTTAPVSVGRPARITALKAGYRTALSRLVAEAHAVGADGVVGVRLDLTVGEQGGLPLWSFLAIGTAVRSTGSSHADTPFTTDLSGAEVAAAMRSGWVPVSLLVVPCMAIKWIDLPSRRSRRRLAPNGEVDALTDLINTCRHQARQDFRTAAAAVHADGAVLTSMTLEHEAHGAEPAATAMVTITGTALAHFAVTRARPATLTIMPIGNRKAAPSR